MIYETIKSKIIIVETFTAINESENPALRARRTLPVSRLIFVNNKHCDAVSSFFSARPRFYSTRTATSIYYNASSTKAFPSERPSPHRLSVSIAVRVAIFSRARFQQGLFYIFITSFSALRTSPDHSNLSVFRFDRTSGYPSSISLSNTGPKKFLITILSNIVYSCNVYCVSHAQSDCWSQIARIQ